MTVAAATLFWQGEASLRSELISQRGTIARLDQKVAALEKQQASQADWSAVAAKVEPSVAKIQAGDATGSGWVVRTDTNGSQLVTNYPVIAGSWSACNATAQVR